MNAPQDHACRTSFEWGERGYEMTKTHSVPIGASPRMRVCQCLQVEWDGEKWIPNRHVKKGHDDE